MPAMASVQCAPTRALSWLLTAEFCFISFSGKVVVVMKLNINTATTYNIFVKTEN